MGLDMYLEKKSKSNPEESAVEVMYWRKTNHIHRWFVQNVQNGVDDCGEYEVSVSQLKELYSTCVSAWLKRDPTLLPTQSGFFFGSTEIDDYYWDDIVNTISGLKPFYDKEESDFNEETFWYFSSW